MKINDYFVDDYVSIKNRHMSVEQKEFDFYNENVNEENKIDFKGIEKKVKMAQIKETLGRTTKMLNSNKALRELLK